MVNRHDATDLSLSWARTSRSIVFGVEKTLAGGVGGAVVGVGGVSGHIGPD